MRIIYFHHAERKIRKNIHDEQLRQLDGITRNGRKEAVLLAKKFKKNQRNVKAIYTSPYLRCSLTAKILNKYLNVPIIEDERINEWKKQETKKEFLKRNINFLEEKNMEYKDDDAIICVTSGVNLTAFFCYFYGIEPNNDIILSQAFGCSPINFVSKHSKLD